MIRLKNITYSIAGKYILSNLSLKVKKGEVVAIIGKSGAGKSTLLKVLAGQIQDFTGQIQTEHFKFNGPTHFLLPGFEEVALVNQDFNLDLHHTVEENILLKMEHLLKEQRLPFLEELLDLVELSAIKQQKVIDCSGGEQQRIAIARALAKEPNYLLLDESMAHLDGHLRRRIFNYIIQLNKIRKTTLILVSHKSEEILASAHRILYLKEGHIEKDEKPEVLFHAFNDSFLVDFFGYVNKVRIEGNTLFFRPIEYQLEQDDLFSVILPLTVKSSTFFGHYFQNECVTLKKEKVMINSIKPLKDIHCIYVKTSNS
jgi:iron(III) transport system ATP-binding protein